MELSGSADSDVVKCLCYAILVPCMPMWAGYTRSALQISRIKCSASLLPLIAVFCRTKVCCCVHEDDPWV